MSSIKIIFNSFGNDVESAVLHDISVVEKKKFKDVTCKAFTPFRNHNFSYRQSNEFHYDWKVSAI